MRSTLWAAGVVLVLSWSSTSSAAGLADSAAANLPLLSTGAPAARAHVHLFSPSEVSRLAQNATPAQGPGPFPTMEPGTRTIFSIAAALVLGFGSGLWILGDPGWSKFLILDAVLIAIELVSFVAAFVITAAAIAGGSGAVAGAAVTIGIVSIISLVVGLVYAGSRIWELIETISKATAAPQVSAPAHMIISGPGRRELSGFVPATANAFNWRF